MTEKPADAEAPEEGGSPRTNFLTAIIDDHLAKGTYGQRVVTRFPPEPNGYLHIGHAKSICLNFGLAGQYDGACNLRFDDTNPLKEDEEYVRAICEDVRWLGFEWSGEARFASDYFQTMYDYAEKLIADGHAYVDSQTVDEIREGRGTVTEAGVHSPYRDRAVRENLDLFRRMRAGEFPDGAHVLRAKIDMSSPNMLMRDPLLYRIRHATHHRSGDDWCIYPMYDYAHCIEDAIEDVTHSICTLEFENNRELYDWVLDNVLPDGKLATRPYQYEFARLSLDYTLMSKRKLLQLVEEGHVSGWDDPRMPTIAGLRRRGYTPEAIRAFADMIGIAKTNSAVDFEKLEFSIRNDLNHRAPRVMAVLRPLKVVLTNYPEDQVEALDASYWPYDVPKEGSREVPFSRELFIERTDFMADPPKGFYRLAPGREVRLRYGYVIRCEEVIRDADGEVTELRCTYDPDTRGGHTPDGRRIKGTIHWVSADQSLPCEVRLYDRLFAVPRPDADPDRSFIDHLNPASLETLTGCRIEPSVADDPTERRYQFERTGYFCRDSGTADALVFNRTVGLRDSWAKQQRKAAPTAPEASAPTKAPAKSDRRPQKRSREEVRAIIREGNPELAAAYERLQSDHGLSRGDADVLSGDGDLLTFFEDALAAHPDPAAVSRWILNEVLRETKDRPLTELPFGGDAVGALVALVSAEGLSTAIARTTFTEMLKGGGSPSEIVDRLDLRQVSDEDTLRALLDVAFDENPGPRTRLESGDMKLMGFFIGKVMQATGGKADAKTVQALIRARLA